MNYEEWAKSVPEAVRNDALWQFETYRVSLLIADLAWLDVTKLLEDPRTQAVASQLYQTVGAISAQVTQGYSSSVPEERARFYAAALGSARAARDWYLKVRHVLGVEVTAHRIDLLNQVVGSLQPKVPRQRLNVLREPKAAYLAEVSTAVPPVVAEALLPLLAKIPLA